MMPRGMGGAWLQSWSTFMWWTAFWRVAYDGSVRAWEDE